MYEQEEGLPDYNASKLERNEITLKVGTKSSNLSHKIQEWLDNYDIQSIKFGPREDQKKGTYIIFLFI